MKNLSLPLSRVIGRDQPEEEFEINGAVPDYTSFECGACNGTGEKNGHGCRECESKGYVIVPISLTIYPKRRRTNG